MRVVLCTPYPFSHVSGVSVFLRDLAAALLERGWEVSLRSPDEFPVVFRAPAGLRSLLLAWMTFWSLVASRAPLDAVHANQPHVQSVGCLLAARIRRTRFIVTYHSELPPEAHPLAGLLQRLAHRALSSPGVPRAFVSKALRFALGRPGEPVVYAGIDPRLAARIRTDSRPHPGPGAPFRFAFAGRQTQSKGFFDLLDAFSSLVAQPLGLPVRLVLLGEPPREEREERNGATARLSRFLEDHGAVASREEVLRILGTAHALILPSYHEGLPLVLLEAMAVGCAPLATAVGGIPEVIEPGATGLLIPPGELGRLREGMVWMVEHPEEVRRIGERARSRILEAFAIGRTADAYVRLYSGRSEGEGGGRTGLSFHQRPG